MVRVQSGREESVKDGLLRRVNAAGLNTKDRERDRADGESDGDPQRPQDGAGEEALSRLHHDPDATDKDAWFLVRETPGIGDFLGLKEPIPMAEHEVNKMLVEQTGAEEEKPRIKIDFQKGDTVA